MEIISKEPLDFPQYLVYTNGDIKSKRTGKMLLPHKVHTGYHNVVLEEKGKRRCVGVHRLVGECHIDNPENKAQVDHIDRNPSNNDISNLRWATHSENSQNKSKYKTNNSGYKNIHFHKGVQKWVYSKTIDKDVFYKRFQTIEEAIEFKKNYEEENNIIA